MSDGKTIIFGQSEPSVASMLPALLQNRGIDPAYLTALMNNNQGGFFGGNGGFQDIIALIVIAAIFGNGNGIFGGGNNNSTEREMIMQTLNRNGVDIGQIAQAVNTSSDQILAGINAVAGSICQLGNSMGQNTNQILTAMLQGNNALTSQLASCCCDLKGVIAGLGNHMERGFSSLAFETQRQTCDISKSIESATSRILEGQRAAEMRELNRDIAERDRKISEQAVAINNAQQSALFGQMIAQATQPILGAVQGLQSDVNGIKCHLPATTVVPKQDVYALPACVAAQYGLYGVPYNNGAFF